MGSSSSKPNAASSSSSSTSTTSSGARRNRSKGTKVFQSYCLGQSSGSNDSDNDNDNDDQASDHQTEETGGKNQRENRNVSDSDQLKAGSCGKTKVEPPDDMVSISPNIRLNEWGHSSLSDTVSRAGSSSSRAFSSRSMNPSTRFLSRFSLFPRNVSFSLSRTTSLGSSGAYPVPSTSFAIRDDEEELRLPTGHFNGLNDRNETPQSCGFASTNSRSCPNSDNRITSTQEVARDIDNSSYNYNVNSHSPRNDNVIGDTERRSTREPVDRNVMFSRTLSVGRLRDRVLRRSPFPNFTLCPFQQERQVGDANRGGDFGASTSNENAFIPPPSGRISSIMSNSLYRSQDYELEIARARGARYHDPLEHRATFLERRRRIRSQVRALQRLGNRFENLTGHERSCISSGQHRTGHCACRIGARDANSNEESGARASISRIVMLAEALFEVLDEIHQQSVVLSSQPSVSSIGSIPAPSEVVECLPLKAYSKSQKQQNEEIAQCYICLVEYEEGDNLRVLPCHHEFHRICVDKWLKEIHRVCPLCRGDICRSDLKPLEN